MTELNQMTDAELVEYYDAHGLADFEGGEVVTPPEPANPSSRTTIVSVRLSTAELEVLDTRASEAGMPLTTYIRTTALAADEVPVDRGEVIDMIEALKRKVLSTAKARATTAASRGGKGKTTKAYPGKTVNPDGTLKTKAPTKRDHAPAVVEKVAATKKVTPAAAKTTTMKKAASRRPKD